MTTVRRATLNLVELASDDLVVQILPELGGRVHRVTYRGFDLLRTPTRVEDSFTDPFLWSGFVMAPWVNRVPGAAFDWRGRLVTLPSNFADGSAIHGQVSASPWADCEDGSWGIEPRSAGFPYPYAVAARAEIEASRFSYSLTLRNTGPETMPAGLGWHPWFTSDDATLEVRCWPTLVYEEGQDHIPVGEPRSVDERDPRFSVGFVPAWGYHSALTGLEQPRVELHWPRQGITADLAFSEGANHLMIYADEDLDAIAIEPQSHAPDGHRRASRALTGGIDALAPGAELRIDFSLTVSERHRRVADGTSA